MKARLLKIARREIRMYERNGKYYVDTGNYMSPEGKTRYEALKYYRFWVLKTARDIFGFKPKSRIF